jgi:hypothetical protein
MLPFLLLFLRKTDRWTWLSFGGSALGLCLLTTTPLQLLPRCQDCLANIVALSGPWQNNDYAFTNPVANDIIALDHLFYRLGLRDRTAVQVAHVLALAALGAWVAWQVTRPPYLSRAAACSLVACYAVLFFYHRYYDLVILIFPLAYTAGRALAEQGRPRWLSLLSAGAMLGSLFWRRQVLEYVSRVSNHSDLPSRMLDALLLPCGDWLVLVALFALVAAERSCRRRAAPGPVRRRLVRSQPVEAVAGVHRLRALPRKSFPTSNSSATSTPSRTDTEAKLPCR